MKYSLPSRVVILPLDRSRNKSSWCYIFAVSFDPRFFLPVDGYNMDERLESTTRYRESQVSLAAVVDQTYTSGGCGIADARLLIDHRRVIFFWGGGGGGGGGRVKFRGRNYFTAKFLYSLHGMLASNDFLS